jgi:hypothetical protein
MVIIMKVDYGRPIARNDGTKKRKVASHFLRNAFLLLPRDVLIDQNSKGENLAL